MEEIQDLMTNGNWSIAIQKYKKLNITATQLSDYIDTISIRELKDVALLGFYCREDIDI